MNNTDQTSGVTKWLWVLVAMLWAGSSLAVGEATGQQGMPSLAPMLKAVTPAVVNIQVTKTLPASNHHSFSGEAIPEELRRWLPELRGPQHRRRGSMAVGAGSGVIVDAEAGFIVTNHHVIADASSISVQLADGRTLEAELVGSDPNTDVALLQVAVRDLTAIELADSESLQVGDFVVAIGNPFGIGQTVTSGIVSALGRTGLNDANYEDFIQTDAAINVGNSGGALVNMAGRLVGINTAIISGDGGNNGIGFAVPVDMVAAVTAHLQRDGEVRRGMLGVTITSVTPELRQALALDAQAGALVTGVLAGGAAEQAGIRVADVIVAINGEALGSGRELRNRIGLMRRGEAVELLLSRSGETVVVQAVIGDRHGTAMVTDAAVVERTGFRGAQLRNVQPQDETAARGGVLVDSVERQSRAWAAGLRSGDLIVEVNRQPVAGVAEFHAMVEDSDRLTVLKLWRQDRELLLMVP